MLEGFYSQCTKIILLTSALSTLHRSNMILNLILFYNFDMPWFNEYMYCSWHPNVLNTVNFHQSLHGCVFIAYLLIRGIIKDSDLEIFTAELNLQFLQSVKVNCTSMVHTVLLLQNLMFLLVIIWPVKYFLWKLHHPHFLHLSLSLGLIYQYIIKLYTPNV